MSRFVGITILTPDNFTGEHQRDRYIVMIGDPNSTGNSTWQIIKGILIENGMNVSEVGEGLYSHFTAFYSVWNETQTVVTLTEIFPSDVWRVLALFKTANVTAGKNFIKKEYRHPHPFLQVNAIRNTDSHVHMVLKEEASPTVEVKRYHEDDVQRPLIPTYGLKRNDVSLGRYLYVSTNISPENLDFAWVKVYYTASDLDRNGDGDADDPEDINESSVKLYYYDARVKRWYVLSEDLHWVNGIVLNTTNVVINGKEYEGFVAVNISSLHMLALAGESPVKVERSISYPAMAAAAGIVLAMICAVALLPGNGTRRKRK